MQGILHDKPASRARRRGRGKTAPTVRAEITAELVAKAEWLLTFGLRPVSIAARLKMPRYVVRVIAKDSKRPACAPPTEPKARRVPNACPSVDAITIRMVRRMLAVGQLPLSEIARQARVSESTVGAIARGQRHLGNGRNPYLMPGEWYVSDGTYCPACGAAVIVLPCRACRVREEIYLAFADFLLR